MAKSLRSKRKRKLRAIKRERLRVKEKERLEVVLGVKGKTKEIERYRPDGSRIPVAVPVAEEVEAMDEDSANVGSTSEPNEGLQSVASTQESLEAEKDVEMKPQTLTFGKKALKKLKAKQSLKRLGKKKRKGRQFKW